MKVGINVRWIRSGAIPALNWIAAVAFSVLSVRYLRDGLRQGITSLSLMQICLAACMATLMWLNIMFGWWRQSDEPRPGHCRRCDYNLKLNTSGICPECGHAIDDSSKTKDG